jgi:hypothetical protein
LYDKVLLTEKRVEAKTIRENDWIVLNDQKYSVEEIYDVPRNYHQANGLGKRETSEVPFPGEY